MRRPVEDVHLFYEAMGRGVTIEASGRMTPETARAAAEAGVDFVSAGALTHSARAIDIALDVDRSSQRTRRTASARAAGPHAPSRNREDSAETDAPSRNPKNKK